MKKILLLCVAVITLALSSKAQNTDINALLQKANEAYVAKDFKLSADLYNEIIKQGYYAPELYYNYGNACYKQDDYKNAILNYERAIKNKTDFEDAKINLKMANQHLRDQFKEIPESNFSAISEQIAKGVGLNGWAAMCLIFFAIGLGLIVLYFFAEEVNIRKFSFSFGFVFIVLSIIALSLGYFTDSVMKNKSEAIIMTTVVTAKSSPDATGTDLFRIHEGLKVQIKDKSGNWLEIRLPDGRVGWVENNTLEEI